MSSYDPMFFLHPFKKKYHTIFPVQEIIILILSFLIFWSHRSQHFAGDGELLSRITEGGKWLVKNELLSQALIQCCYQIASFWHLTPLEIMNALSCFCGILSLWVLFRFADHFYGISYPWPLLLFLSSGFFIYACGHTEYYPIMLPVMFLYGYAGLVYLQNENTIKIVIVFFLLATALHFAMLIALPSLFLLPWLKGRVADYKAIFIRLFPCLLLLFLIRNHSQLLFGHKASGLSPAWNLLPLFPYENMYRYYAFFDWHHLIDWLYGWSRRSWIFWPMILWISYSEGFKSLLRKDRLFFFVYTICFTLWSMVWHPDLSMLKDWDLFALEAAPCLLLLLSCIPSIRQKRFPSTVLVGACIASTLIVYSYILQKADLPQKGYGSIKADVGKNIQYEFTLDGFNRQTTIPRLREGIYNGKFIDRTHREVTDFHVFVLEGYKTSIPFEVSYTNK